jgi:hypothetical protein
MQTKFLYTMLLVLLVSTGTFARDVVERLEIQKNDSVTLTGNTHIKELLVHADKNGSGQLIINSGIVQVDKLILSFSFSPNEWTPIAFPSTIEDLRMPQSTNIAELGINFGSGAKRLQMRRYDQDARAIDREGWIATNNPFVPANTGVLINVVTGSTSPQAIEFYFNNTTLSNVEPDADILIDLDMKGKMMQQDYTVTIQPVNAAGTPLEVVVRNAPSLAPAPINYAEELAVASIYFTEDQQAIRLALPNSEPARILLMDRKMKKVIDAYQYVSPAAIQVGHLRKGTYHLLVEYGPASEIKTFRIK